MNIFDNQEQGPLGRLLDEQPGKRRETPALFLLRVEGDVRFFAGKSWQKVRYEWSQFLSKGDQSVWTLRKVRAQEIEEWRVRTQTVLREAMAIKNSPSLGPRDLDQLAYEARLADARLTCNQRELTAPSARGFQEAQERG
jgi:hypothetical protein